VGCTGVLAADLAFRLPTGVAAAASAGRLTTRGVLLAFEDLVNSGVLVDSSRSRDFSLGVRLGDSVPQ
jgi:hypothetical protein